MVTSVLVPTVIRAGYLKNKQLVDSSFAAYYSSSWPVIQTKRSKTLAVRAPYSLIDTLAATIQIA